MKKALQVLFAIVMIIISCVFLVGAADESKYEYHDSSWYLSEEEATAFMGFIYNLAPEDLADKEFASLGVDLLTGKYADSPEDEYIIKMTFCEVALTQMNSKVTKYDHASVITSENLINWLKGQVGENPTEDYINSTCNGYLNKMKESLKKTLLICNLSEREMELYESLEMQISGYETITGIAPKAMKYAKAAKAGVEAVLYAGSSSRSAMYQYFLAYARTRGLADSTVDGFELAMNYNVVALVNQGLYDPFLNWATEDNQKVLNRWAELFYWLMKDVGEVEFTNDNTSGTTSSTLEPVEFVPGTGTYEGKCGDKVKWHLDASTGILNIYGEGSMDNYTSASKTPWYNYRQYINFVRVSDGVISIGNYAFAECTTLDKVYLAADVYNIGNRAFYNCVAMRLFVVDGIVNNIGQYAFANCKNLVYFDVPDRVTNISNGVFSGCTGLVSVDLPSDLVSVGSSAFSGCSSMAGALVLPDSLTTIGSSAFQHCSGITGEVILPENIKTIGDSAFRGCSNIESVYIPDGVKIINEYTFRDCIRLKNIEIPESVNSIGDFAFYNCESLEKIKIPEGVTTLPKYTFYNCIGLRELTIPVSTEIQYRGEYFESTFAGCSNIEKITYTKGTGLMHTVFYDRHRPTYICRNKLKEVVIEEGVKSIAEKAFYSCSELEKLTLPDSITSIGKKAFNGCSSIVSEWSIILPKGLTKIGSDAFSNCSGITGKLIIPMSVTNIDSSTFSGCSGITGEVILPENIKTIGDSAFRGCSNIESVYISDGVKIINEYTFRDCIRLKYIEIPESVNSIGDFAFYNCESLEKIKIPEGVTTLPKYTFYNCIGLRELTIPVSTEIQYRGEYFESTFAGCSNIEKITYTKGTGLMHTVFYDRHRPAYICRNKLKEVVIEEGVKSIAEKAFYSCSELEKVELPDSVTVIGNSAFSNCISLIELTIPNKSCSIYDSSSTIYSKTTIKAPCGSPAHNYAKKYSRTFVSTEHTLTDWLADFTVNGETMTTSVYKKCVYCNEVVDLTTHTTTGWISDTEATCTTDGSKHLECLDCGNRYDAVIPATGHTEVVDKAISATCTETGLTEGKHCSVCSAVLVEQTVVDSLGHDMGDWYESLASSCTEKGEERTDCSRCDYFETRETQPNGHSYTAVVTDPTCTVGGYTAYTCSCGDTYTSDETEALGHNMSGFVQTVSPTCTEKGVTRSDCSRCDHYETAEVDMLPHTESQWIIDKDATCTKEGSKHIECTECHTTLKTETIQKTAHNYGNTVVAPTCTQGGFTIYTCTECTDSYISDETAATDHNYDDGVCTNCGDSKIDNCSHLCHKSGFMGFIWKIINFFNKLFKTNKACSCGMSHY